MAKYTIEIAGPHNEYHIFAPLSENLRGRWDQSNVGHRDKGEAMKALSIVHVIPGIYVSLDTGRREGCRFDPLNTTPEGKAIWEKIASVIRQHKMEFGGEKKPWEPAVHRDLTNDQIKDWLWAMARAVQAGYARLVAGSDPLPSLDEIRKLPGKRTRDLMNTGPQTHGEQDGGKLRKYVDEVPDGPAAELAGAGAGTSAQSNGGGQGGQSGGGSDRGDRGNGNQSKGNSK